MLFLLTGEVQIGKTRWLERLVADLTARGALVAGVLAPGQWVPSSGPRADQRGFEKQGIDNVLLPAGKRFPFARRRDLARVEGIYDAASQAGRAELGWHIDDNAIARVNAHFDELEGKATEASAAGMGSRHGLLVVDELGRLEIWRGEGLSSAVRLVQGGPSPGFPCALVVVRDYLADKAEKLLAPEWDAVMRIGPNEEGRRAVIDAVLSEAREGF